MHYIHTNKNSYCLPNHNTHDIFKHACGYICKYTLISLLYTSLFREQLGVLSEEIVAHGQGAQLFSANAFSLNVLSTLTATYSQSIANTNNFFTYIYQRKQISRK